MPMTIITESENTKLSLDSIKETNADLYFKLQMNSRKIANPRALYHIAKIVKELP